MTRRLLELLGRALKFIILALLVYGLALTFPPDLALLLAGDTLLYFEAATAVWLAAQVTRLRWALTYARFVLRRAIRRARVRARRVARRIAVLRPPSGDDERPAFAFA